MPAVGKNDPDPADPPTRSGCADHKPLPEERVSCVNDPDSG
jgi:hypothetical protein